MLARTSGIYRKDLNPYGTTPCASSLMFSWLCGYGLQLPNRVDYARMMTSYLGTYSRVTLNVLLDTAPNVRYLTVTCDSEETQLVTAIARTPPSTKVQISNDGDQDGCSQRHRFVETCPALPCLLDSTNLPGVHVRLLLGSRVPKNPLGYIAW